MVNGARLIGPMIAAELVALFGEGWCFAIDATSYLAVIGSLLAMRVPRRKPPARGTRMWHDLVEGWHYVGDVPFVRAVLLLMAASSVLGGAYSTLMPLVAGSALHGGPHTLGILMGAAGCGALSGALFLAHRQRVVGLGRIIGRCTFVLALGMIAMRLAINIYVAVPFAFAIGGGLMVQMASTNTIVQTIVDHDKLGRVMSLYGVAFFAGAPVGALLEGSLADAVGPLNTFALAGVVMLACALLYWRALPRLRAATRPLYERLGLLETGQPVAAPGAQPNR
jgi:predicted MFS family arabinose efflux permease